MSSSLGGSEDGVLVEFRRPDVGSLKTFHSPTPGTVVTGVALEGDCKPLFSL